MNLIVLCTAMSNFLLRMLLRLLKAILALLVIFAAATLLLEVGFRTRDWIESRKTLSSPEINKTRVLFIGDSVLGFMNQEGSLSSELVKQITEMHPNQYQFQELSAPALTTREVKKKLTFALERFRPHAVLFMAGKSDYVVPHLRQWGFLLNLRIFRLLFVAFFDARMQWLKWTDDQKFIAKQDLRAAWKALTAKDCNRAIPLFEQAIPLHKDFDRRDKIYRGLHYCYIETKQYAEAVQFFSQIEEPGLYKELVQSFVQIHQYLLNPQSAKPIDSAEARDRDQVRTNMWFYRQMNQAHPFFLEYINMPKDIADHLKENSIENIRFIIKELTQQRAQVFLMQYPLDHASVLEKAIGVIQHNVRYLDIRNWLSRVTPNEFIKFWDEDIEHISAYGNKWLAKKIEPILVKNLKDQP